ncbi:MAG: hypothetical protein NXH97_05370 [Rhodobacteraceae bacterium]|nr:hypothetical protein [Paracoccaceae bacterium]
MDNRFPHRDGDPQDTPARLPWATVIALLVIPFMLSTGLGFVVGLWLAGS